MDEKDRPLTAALFAALGSEYRLRMIELLAEGERCVCEITPYFPTAFSVVSHHLSVLEQAGAVVSRRDGRWMRYRLADESLVDLLDRSRRLATRHSTDRGTARRPKASDRPCCKSIKARRTNGSR